MEESAGIKILVIDSKAIVCRGISELLKDYQDFQIVGCVGNSEEALTCCETKQPDVVIIDPDFPCKSNGVSLIRKINKKYPRIRIIVLTNILDEMTIREVLQANVVGYLLKAASVEDFAHAIRTAFPGKPILSPEVTQLLIDGMNASDQYKQSLTRREYQVLALIVQGKNNAEISKALNVSFSTVQFHVGNIFTKLNTHNRVEAAMFAVRMHLLP
jgi:DNA-binding NarL/FixJ family response regulator